MNLEKALTIDGWMTPDELKWLAEQAQQHKVIVEIGSYLGRSTRALADNTKGVVYAIDDWYGPRDVELSKEERETTYGAFLHNVSDLRNVYPIKCDHADATVWQAPDMVFIDGSHKYEDVKRDIEIWLPQLKNGALICGHDSNFPGVAKAIRELLPGATPAVGTIWQYVVGSPIVKRATPKLAIAVAHGGRPIPCDWYLSMKLLQLPTNCTHVDLWRKGLPTEVAREQMTEQAMQLGAEYILFIDDDTQPPPSVILQLMQVLDQSEPDVMACGGIYTTKRYPPEPIVYKEHGQGSFWKWRVGEVFPCWALGTGCLMIRMEVFKHMPRPWWRWLRSVEELAEYPEIFGETLATAPRSVDISDDIFFFTRLHAMGYKALAHGGVLPIHWNGTKSFWLPKGCYPLEGLEANGKAVGWEAEEVKIY